MPAMITTDSTLLHSAVFPDNALSTVTRWSTFTGNLLYDLYESSRQLAKPCYKYQLRHASRSAKPCQAYQSRPISWNSLPHLVLSGNNRLLTPIKSIQDVCRLKNISNPMYCRSQRSSPTSTPNLKNPNRVTDLLTPFFHLTHRQVYFHLPNREGSMSLRKPIQLSNPVVSCAMHKPFAHSSVNFLHRAHPFQEISHTQRSHHCL